MLLIITYFGIIPNCNYVIFFLVGQKLEAYLKNRQSSGIRPVKDHEAVNVSMHLRVRSVVSLVSTSSEFHVKVK